MLSKLFIKLIEYYQSMDKEGTIFDIECNFVPSCSEYAKLSLSKYGLFKGLYFSMIRIKKCNNKDLFEKIYDPLL